MIAALGLILLIWPGAAPARADLLRLATFHTDFSRAGPGLLLRDLLRGDDVQIMASVTVIAAAGADVVVLQGMDYDAGGAALAQLADLLAAQGAVYPHMLALRPNTGRPSGVDLDGDGQSWRARDAHGFGWFNGQGGMAVLSRHPFGPIRDFTEFLWADLPQSAASRVLPQAAVPILRLASVAAWDVVVAAPTGPFHLLALHANTPVFDGPEDRNGWRNADELRFWQLYLDGWAPDGVAFAADDFALVGTLNLDPDRGEGRQDALRALLDHPLLQDARPRGRGGGLNTVDWPEPVPGDLRVDYILPAAGLRVAASGVIWPEDDRGALTATTVAAASDHRLVWVDLVLGGG